MQRAFDSIFFSTLSLATLSCLIPLSTQAQVTPDGTTSTTVNQDGNNFTIEQGDRIGNNLFHSFNQFSVPTLGSAVFNNAGDIANIFSRVTGSSISSIDGLISANGAANLFLINPNGIIFGENASLNLGGSFFASTADSLLFEGNAEFSAVNPQAPPLLEVSIPIGASFRDNPGDIVNKSIAPDSATNTPIDLNFRNEPGDIINRFITPDPTANNPVGLQVQPGKSIFLIGGDVSLDGGVIYAPGGRIELGGLSAAGKVGLNEDFSLSFPSDISKADISLKNNALFSTTSKDLLNGNSITNRAGNIEVTAKNLSLEAESIISTSTQGKRNAGDINLNVTNNLSLEQGSRITSETGGIFAKGNAGDINVKAANLTLTNGAEIVASTQGNGNAGNIGINANNLRLENGGQIINNTNNTGDAGSIKIQVRDGILKGKNTGIKNTGAKAGSIQILQAESLLLTDNAQISTNNFLTGRSAGSISITETKKLDIRNGASITAQANTLSLGGITIAGIGELESLIEEALTKSGTEGDLIIEGITIDDSIIEGLTKGGKGGDVTLETKELTIANNGSVTVNSQKNLAGNLNIKSDILSLNRGFITAETGGVSQGNEGANINLEISDIWRIENESIVSATAFEDADGGNININTDPNLSNTELVLLAFPSTGANGSDISANADQGDGGRIDITAAGIFGIDFRDISANEARSNSLNDFTVSSQFGTSGETIINRTVDDPTSGLINLPASVGDASDQISQNPCEQGVGSEFIITGKGGLPPNVNESLNSESAQVGLIETVTSQPQTVGENGIRPNPSTTTEAVPAQGWVFNDKGEVTLTAYKTTNTERQNFRKTPINSCSAP